MRSKKFFLMFIASLVIFAFAAGAYASTGSGYFGDGADPEVEDDFEPADGRTTTPVVSDYDDDDDDFGDLTPVTTTPATPVITPAPRQEDYDYTPTQTTPAITKKAASNLENRSEDPQKVISSYGLDGGTANALIQRHKDAAKGKGNREQSERYINITNQYPMDYLAPYKAALANYEMGRNSTAQKFVNIALERNPNYVPAKQLKRKVEGALKR